MMGSKKANAEESAHIERCKSGPCIPCVSLFLQGKLAAHDVFLGGDYDHKKSGNVRRGHMEGFCSCAWHHRRHPWGMLSFAEMTRRFGPSLMDGGKLFARTYGTDDELIELQRQVLENPAWEGGYGEA